MMVLDQIKHSVIWNGENSHVNQPSPNILRYLNNKIKDIS